VGQIPTPRHIGKKKHTHAMVPLNSHWRAPSSPPPCRTASPFDPGLPGLGGGDERNQPPFPTTPCIKPFRRPGEILDLEGAILLGNPGFSRSCNGHGGDGPTFMDATLEALSSRNPSGPGAICAGTEQHRLLATNNCRPARSSTSLPRKLPAASPRNCPHRSARLWPAGAHFLTVRHFFRKEAPPLPSRPSRWRAPKGLRINRDSFYT